MAPGLGSILLCVAGAAALSAALTRAAIAYAHRREILDQPGRRRSHSIPTPRGGGIGIVVALLAGIAWLSTGAALPAGIAATFALGLLLVAVIGWIDDHRPLPASLRLIVHFIASVTFVSQLPDSSAGGESWMPWLRFGLQVLLLATAINFWNFMDGVNGLMATQSAWVAICAMVFFGLGGQWPLALLSGVLAGACLGFLPFNFPRARIFLGDVGSGGLGFACGALLLLTESMRVVDSSMALLIASAVLLDAGFTLTSRMLRGRRWYNPHREHLYQWLVRSGLSHAQATWLYLSWNLILVLPLLWLSYERPGAAPLFGLVALFAGAAAWCYGKHAARARVRAGRSVR